MPIKVIVNGAAGKMGQATVEAITHESGLQLVATTNRHDHLHNTIVQHQADVVIDFTLPNCVFDNAQVIIDSGARPIIGTSGLTHDHIQLLEKKCRTKKLGGIIAPNFSIGAILMMKYAQDAAKYFPDVEIIEAHHPQKVDAPSSTAKKTAELIAKNKTQKNTSAAYDAKLNTPRALVHHGIPIHAMRLSGVFANQSVIFGGNSETFTLQHHSIDRKAMMPGVFLCCRKVMSLNHLVYGMETLL